ncbi:ABC transporter ATP-binding protein [Lentisphaerota bacterium ZTH]|nr:ABC transporter ATP-binding protein [Lentisphaerota bacterium]WET06621.1 ABC transporter ATP-binding protein [Lentisphaerota bacterium ZTH]
MKLLQVKNLSIDFKDSGKWLPVVSDVNFDLEQGEILAIVGESGCGKSVTCMSLTKLLPVPPARYRSGEIEFRHRRQVCDPLRLSRRRLREIRGGGIAYIFQEPSVSLNPVYRVGDQIAEAIELHRPEIDDVEAEVINQLRQVGIPAPESRINCYPHELSGGMQQRIMIAMALACNPELLIADEPTTALDVTIQAQILELLTDLRDKRDMSIVLVTHNLGIVSEMADRVVIMYAGHTVEAGRTDEVISKPSHPYTRALLKAVPRLGCEDKRLQTISGNVPTPANFPQGCRFFGRCEHCASLSEEEQKLCAEKTPEWTDIGSGHFCRCWYRL